MTAIKELIRVVTPGGMVLIYVWALEQEHHQKQTSNYIKPNRTAKHRSASSGTETAVVPAFKTESKDMETVEKLPPVSRLSSVSGTDKRPPDFCSSEDAPLESTSKHPPSEEGMSGNLCYSNACPSSLQTQLPVHVNRTQFKHQDLLVPWHLKSKNARKKEDGCKEKPVYHRYYHVFREGELEDLCRKVNHARIDNSYYDKGNWCVVIHKNNS